ncbi:hypothetical protein MMC14_008007 [Varicellaria rhodocarpa]|nr:hypothetical protein [Varicellaria rhodocarpa]
MFHRQTNGYFEGYEPPGDVREEIIQQWVPRHGDTASGSGVTPWDSMGTFPAVSEEPFLHGHPHSTASSVSLQAAGYAPSFMSTFCIPTQPMQGFENEGSNPNASFTGRSLADGEHFYMDQSTVPMVDCQGINADSTALRPFATTNAPQSLHSHATSSRKLHPRHEAPLLRPQKHFNHSLPRSGDPSNKRLVVNPRISASGKVQKVALVKHGKHGLSKMAVKVCRILLSHHCWRFPHKEIIFGLSIALEIPYKLLHSWFKKYAKYSKNYQPEHQTKRNTKRKYTESYRHNRRKCVPAAGESLSAGSGKKVNHPFACTNRCGRVFKRKDDWRKHEEINYPQEIWVCRLEPCVSGPVEKRTSFRKDKFREHLTKKHPVMDVTEGDVGSARFTVDSKFSRKCIFRDCNEEFDGWKGRIDHLAEHMVTEWDISQWRDSADESNARREETTDDDSSDSDLSSSDSDKSSSNLDNAGWNPDGSGDDSDDFNYPDTDDSPGDTQTHHRYPPGTPRRGQSSTQKTNGAHQRASHSTRYMAHHNVHEPSPKLVLGLRSLGIANESNRHARGVLSTAKPLDSLESKSFDHQVSADPRTGTGTGSSASLLRVRTKRLRHSTNSPLNTYAIPGSTVASCESQSDVETSYTMYIFQEEYDRHRAFLVGSLLSQDRDRLVNRSLERWYYVPLTH